MSFFNPTNTAFSTFIPKSAVSQITDLAFNAVKQTSQPSFDDVWRFDTGATVHICNDKSFLSSYQPAVSSVKVGNTEATILGFGTLSVKPTDSIDGTSFSLKNVAFAPGFHLNLVSADRAADAGIFLDGRTCTLIESGGTQICRLNRKAGIYLLRWDTKTPDGMPVTTSTHTAHAVSIIPPLIHDFGKLALASYEPKVLNDSPELWHRRLGHVGADVVKHLQDHATNIAVDPSHPASDSPVVCEVCKLTKAKKQI
ncbi:hypothetical protein N7535_002664 [Penicillium sp. DV-2018c]|nr:hypothetical protein N7461_001651 [Penicillium sp. DV-2018c]KAJ5575738.1 hypothetical protein N7535_002664 [Penicillium sp. DV-2018c]